MISELFVPAVRACVFARLSDYSFRRCRWLFAVALLAAGCGRSARWSEIPEDPEWPDTPSEYSISVVTAPTPFAARDALEENPAPVLQSSDVEDFATAYVADPFLFEKEGRWYLFYELLGAHPRRGCIAWAETEDGGRTWQHKGRALVEPFHMSFPYIFEWDGEVYMVPETHHIEEIRLYKADPFPSAWTPVAVLARGVFVDPALLRHDGRWWLFASTLDSRNLHLFLSEQLKEGWEEHPQSPVVRNDVHRARPAGRVFEHDGTLWRMAMDCAPRYGFATRLMEISTLTPTAFEQRECEVHSPLISAGLVPWGTLGMHHYDPWLLNEDSETWLIAIDGNRRAQPEIPLEVRFDNGTMLLGATQRPRRVGPGETVMLRLYWKGLPSYTRTSLFVHFRRGRKTLFSIDHPISGPPDFDDLYVDVPDDVTPGPVTVWVGQRRTAGRRRAVDSPYPQAWRAVQLPITFTIDGPQDSDSTTGS